MKLDIGHEPQHHFPIREGTSKCVGCYDNHWESEALVSTTEVKVEGKVAYISLAECLSREKALETSCHQVQQHVQGGDEVLSEFLAGTQDDTEHMKVPTVLLPNSEIVKREADFYTDKAVTEIERPKMIVCFEKDEYQVVKDICMDKEMQTFDKVSLQRYQVEQMNVSAVSHSNGDAKTTRANEIPDLDIMKSFPLSCQLPTDACETVNTQSFPKPIEGNNNSVETDQSNNISDGKYSGQNPFVEHELDKFQHTVDLLNVECIENMQPSNQDPSEEIQPVSSAVSSIVEPEKQVPVNFPSDNKVESGNVMSHSTDATVTATVTPKETSTELKQDIGTKNGSMNGETPSDGLTSSAQSSIVHYGFADSGLLGPHGLSDRITYTGQVPYSGSISLRSDSSTTSTRSFAFPVLHSEWNSSPVKMAKADRRHYKRHRGWRANLFCCRF